MSRRTGRLRRRPTIRTDEQGKYPNQRFAGLSIRCRKCEAQLIIVGRYLLPGDDGELWIDHSTLRGEMFWAGPAEDQTSRYAFDCERCGTVDQLVATTRLEEVSAELFERCRTDGRARTEKYVI